MRIYILRVVRRNGLLWLYLKIYGLSIFFMDESDTIHLTLDKNETRTDKKSLEKEHRKLEETLFLSNSVR